MKSTGNRWRLARMDKSISEGPENMAFGPLNRVLENYNQIQSRKRGKRIDDEKVL
jgi:hypothetical protein